MAHEIDMTNQRANMAFTGDRKQIWHGLGHELEVGATIEQWITSAGLDWEVKSSDVEYKVEVPGTSGLIKMDKTFQDRKVLYRSDSMDALSVVSKDFKVVQPKEVVEFFRDLVERHDMQLSTAGSLFGGRRFWALAELGKSFEVTSGDVVNGFLLLTTAVDGSLNTTAKFVAERVVCNNTLNIAMGEKNKNLVKVSHRCQWDSEKAKMDLGLIDSTWLKFITDMRKLAATPITDMDARKFLREVTIEDTNKELTRHEERKLDNLVDLYYRGMGAEMSYGSYWGVLNAITQQFTHGSGKRNESHQFWDSNFCNGAAMKDAAYSKALALV